MLAIDGKSGESWLFLAIQTAVLECRSVEVQPGPEAAKRLGMEHVVDWSELEGFLKAPRADQALPIYYGNGLSTFTELPANLLSPKSPQAPMWLQIILQKWPAFEAKESGERIERLWQFRVRTKPLLCAQLRRRL